MQSSTNDTVFVSIASGGFTFLTNPHKCIPSTRAWLAMLCGAWVGICLSFPTYEPRCPGRSPQVSAREVLGTETGR